MHGFFRGESRIETSENSVPPDRTEPLAPSESAIPSRAVEDLPLSLML